MSELVSRPTRSMFRRLMTYSFLGAINDAFQDEGFAPNTESTYEDSSARRHRVQSYLEAIDWSDLGQVRRALRAFERLLRDIDRQDPDFVSFTHALRRDGFRLDEETGQINRTGPHLSASSLAGLADASAIREQLDRLQRAVVDDPALAVGSAKELVESTAKLALNALGRPVGDRADVPALVREVQQALALHPSSITPGPDGSDAVKKILGSVSGIAIGLAELRNRGYGTGHGPATARIGLRPRHAHLAANAALTWCHLILDTLDDAEAPWRQAAP